MVDQTELARIAAEDRDETVRRAAAECLTDRGPLAIFDDQGRGVTELARIAAEDRDETVRGAAAECSTDRGPLATVDDQGPGVEARCRATNSIDDQAQLAKIAADDEHWQVRSVATKRLTDREELARVAVDDKDERVQQMARGRLADFARKDEEDFEQFCQTAFRLVNCPPSEPLVEFERWGVIGRTRPFAVIPRAPATEGMLLSPPWRLRRRLTKSPNWTARGQNIVTRFLPMANSALLGPCPKARPSANARAAGA